MCGKHMINCWSRTQATVALFSAEADPCATVKASSETHGVKSRLQDFGHMVSGHVLGDASAALGIIKRQGLGRLRHVDASYLWVQQAPAERTLAFEKVGGKDDPADGQTKYVSRDLVDKYCRMYG